MLTTAIVVALMPFAQAPWVGSHCRDRAVVYVLSPAAMEARYPALPNLETMGAVRKIADPSCEVWLNGSATVERACAHLTHELGHLAGMPHSANRRSVMYWIPPTPRRCQGLTWRNGKLIRRTTRRR